MFGRRIDFPRTSAKTTRQGKGGRRMRTEQGAKPRGNFRAFRKVAVLGVAALLALGLTRLAQGYPEVVERVYARGIYPVWG